MAKLNLTLVTRGLFFRGGEVHFSSCCTTQKQFEWEAKRQLWEGMEKKKLRLKYCCLSLFVFSSLVAAMYNDSLNIYEMKKVYLLSEFRFIR